MRKAIFLILIFLSLILLLVRLSNKPLASFLGLSAHTGIKVDANVGSKVVIDGSEVGKTPYQDESYSVGDHLIEVAPLPEGTGSGKITWRAYVRLNQGTLTVVNRDLEATQANSSGEVITLEPGSGIAVVSAPAGADVEVDGTAYGKTPLYIPSITPGDHLFIVGKPDFLKRSIRANLVAGFKLNLSVDLAISEADLTQVTTVPIQSSKQVVVKQTPIGFLRVRKDATINSAEVERVAPGDVLILLEEIPGWDRVKLSDGKEGYVSSAFVEKK